MKRFYPKGSFQTNSVKANSRGYSTIGFLLVLALCWMSMVTTIRGAAVHERESGCLPETQIHEDAAETRIRKRNGIAFLPVLYYTPETRIAGGALVNYFFRESGSNDSTRASSLMPVIVYTQNKQVAAEISSDLYWKDETYYSKGYVSFSKFPDKFYGIGNNTAESNEEDFTPQFFILRVNFQKNLQSGFYAGIGYEFESRKMVEVEDTGLLAAGDIIGSDGGTVSGGGFLLNWDTRNSNFFPTRGRYYQLSASYFGGILGSDFDFSRYQLDMREYLPASTSSVLAVQGYLSVISGDAPFHWLSLLGGANMMRGYYQGRFRDKNMVVMQSEYRTLLWWRIGASAFAGAGDVMKEWDQLRLNNLKYSFGGGLRYHLNRKEGINIRFDVGFGENTSGVYITIGEAF